MDEKECSCCCTCNSLKFFYRPFCSCDCRALCADSSDDDDGDLKTLVYKKWAINGCQLFYSNSFQDKLLKVFDLNIANYFLVVRILFIWVFALFFLGLVFTAMSFYTTDDDVNPAIPVCQANYSAYYMCPLCDGSCDFWYLKQAVSAELCTRHFRLVFDNPVMWVFSAIVIVSAFIANIIMIKKATSFKKGKDVYVKGDRAKYDSWLIAWQYVWMIVYVIIIIALYFVFVIFSLFLEDKVRQFLVSQYNASNFLLFILGTLPSALIQTSINHFCKFVYRHGLLHCLHKDHNDNTCCGRPTHKFITTLIPNLIIAYLPIVYRIIFFGNIVSDPRSGYRYIAGNIRFQHCPRYGCIDVGAFTFFGILSIALSSLFQTIRLTFPVKWRADSYDTKKSSDDDTESLGTRLKSDIVDHYVDLIVLYGFIILFMTATGAIPILAGLIAIPIKARYIASSYLISNPKKSDRLYLGFAWKCSFVFLTVLAIFSNIAIVIPNSRFIQHVSYSKYTGHNGIILNFDGYLDRVLPQHNLTTIVDIDAFPDLKVHQLPMYYPDGQEVQNDDGQALLYLPFINFTCLNEHFDSVGYSFTRTEYENFIETHFNNTIVQYDNPKHVEECFDTTVTCRSRGFLGDTEEAEVLKTTRLVFVVCFVVPVVTAFILIIPCFIIMYKKCKQVLNFEVIV